MAEPIRDPQKLQSQVDEFQNLQRQLQMVGMQRQQVSLQVEEMKMAAEELKDAPGKIYKAIGNLLIETSAAAAKKDLTEKLETFEVRAGSLGKQEDKLRAKSEELRAMLEKALATSQRGAAEASG